ncbi:hypothetical protein V866_005197 [Kwoniella sp. B9012]|uniref:Stc1 domain-containing protein n=1 Tax=Kwoniella europaea PYCC6329 TaxID=1423913 RepID=A0AAX4KNI9_9TREE
MPNTADLDNPSCTALTRSKLRTQHKDGALRTCGKHIRYLPGDSGNDPICYSCRDNKGAMEEYDSRSGRTETDLLRDWKSYPSEANDHERWKEFSRRRRRERIRKKHNRSSLSIPERSTSLNPFPTGIPNSSAQEPCSTLSGHQSPGDLHDYQCPGYVSEVDQVPDTWLSEEIETHNDFDRNCHPTLGINFSPDFQSLNATMFPLTTYGQSYGTKSPTSASMQNSILAVNQSANTGLLNTSTSQQAWTQRDYGNFIGNPSVQYQWQSSSVHSAPAAEDCSLSNPPRASTDNLPAPMDSTEAIMEGVEGYRNGAQDLERMIHAYFRGR